MTAVSDKPSTTPFGLLQQTTKFLLKESKARESLKSTTSEKRPILDFAFCICEIFGNKEENFKKKLDKTLLKAVQKVKNVFKQTHSFYNEKNEEGKYIHQEYIPYDGNTFTKLNDITNDYLPAGVNDGPFFKAMRLRYYDLLAIPQEMCLYGANCDRDAFKALEKTRELALKSLCLKLKQPIIYGPKFRPSSRVLEESKGEPAKEEVSEEEIIALAKLLFGDAEALPGVLFRDLLATWAEKNGVNCTDWIFEQLKLDQWLEKRRRGTNLEAFSEVQGEAFSEFLINSSIQYLKDKLKIDFYPPVEAILRESFKDESVRAEVVYFAECGDFSQIRWDALEAPSKFLLNMIQIFRTYVRRYTIEPEKETRSIFFQMILLGKGMGCFAQIEKDGPKVSGEREAAFAEAWRCLRSLLDSIIPNEQELWRKFNEPELLPFFIFLLNREKLVLDRWRGLFVWFMKEANTRISFTVPLVKAFCETNREMTPAHKSRLMNFYSQLFEGTQLKHLEKICFDPPVNLAVRSVTGAIKKITCDEINQFLEEINEYEFSEIQILELVHRRIFDSINCITMLTILKEDTPKLGIFSPDPWGILTTQPNYSSVPSLEMREKACKIVMEAWSDRSSRFLLNDPLEHYLAILHLSRKTMIEVSEFFLRLQTFFPDMDPIARFFFFRYYPKCPAVESLIEARKKFFSRDSPPGLYLDFQKLSHFSNLVDEVVKPLVENHCPLEYKEAYQRRLKMSFLSAIRYPSQFPIDFLAILYIDKEGNIHFDPSFNHLGRFNLSSPLSSFRVYVNWNLIHGRLELFMAVYNQQDGSATSCSVPLLFPIDQLTPAFWGCLRGFSKQVFAEPDDGEIAEPFILEELDGVPRKLAEIGLEFLKTVKINYRKLFFPELQQEPSSDLEPRQVAARGNIYPGGSLLPKSWLELEPYRRHFYLLNVEDDFIMKKYRDGELSNDHPYIPFCTLQVEGSDVGVDCEVEKGCVTFRAILPGGAVYRPLQYPPDQRPLQCPPDPSLAESCKILKFNLLSLKAAMIHFLLDSNPYSVEPEEEKRP